MTPETLKIVQQRGLDEDFELFQKIQHALDQLPDFDLGHTSCGEPILLNCHMLARATAKVFGLMYEDVWFLRRWSHTAVVKPRRFAIDVYPVGILYRKSGSPLFLDPEIYRSMYNSAYVHPVDGHTIVTADFSGEEYLHNKVDFITHELAKYTN